MTQRIPNREQQAVIDELDRNLILYASAGTGKTFTVAKRVSRILERGRALPEEILCLTFTIKAADEMREDIAEYSGEAAGRVTVRTIHGFAYQVLREESATAPQSCSLPNVMDDVDEEDVLRGLAVSLGLSENAPVLKGRGVFSGLVGELKRHRMRLGLSSKDEERDFQEVYRDLKTHQGKVFDRLVTFYSREEHRQITDREFISLMDSSAGKLVSLYNERLRESNLLDFDDLICQTYRLLCTREGEERWRSRYRYIFIDEMQDTSRLEYDMLKQLFPGNHVMMCGDVFQTIYEWRGSSPEEVLGSFIQEFDAKTFMLSENYRATRLLTQATFGYLRGTYPGLVGKMCPPEIVTKSDYPGDPILNVRVRDEKGLAAWIYRYLEEHCPEDPARICILSRSHNQIASVYSQLRRICLERQGSGKELHFFTVDEDMKFFRKPVIKDILAFCRVVLNRSDAVSLSRIMINQVRGVGEKTVEKMSGLGEVGISLTSMIDPGSFRDGDPYARLVDAARKANIVIYDTETTGLDLARDQIIQISAIRLGEGGEIIGTLDQLVIPTVEISKSAERTHHMTMRDLLDGGGTEAREALQRFSAFVDGAVLVGHNSLRFDAPLVARQLRENGLPPLNLLAEYDTMVISKQFFPKLVNHRLATLCEKYGIVNENAHNALGDITATGKVLWHLLQECIIPTSQQRRCILEEKLPRFSGLFQFIEELGGILAQDRVDEMVERIIDRCRLKRRFPEDGNQMAISDLLHVIRESQYEDGAAFLNDFLNDAALSGSQIDLLIRKLHKIPIITVHQAKGCEFDTVIVACAEDDVFPSFSAKKSGSIEEEKRVFYVAISRARTQLILISRSVRENRWGEWPVEPSPFIRMIPRETIRDIVE